MATTSEFEGAGACAGECAAVRCRCCRSFRRRKCSEAAWRGRRILCVGRLRLRCRCRVCAVSPRRCVAVWVQELRFGALRRWCRRPCRRCGAVAASLSLRRLSHTCVCVFVCVFDGVWVCLQEFYGQFYNGDSYIVLKTVDSGRCVCVCLCTR